MLDSPDLFRKGKRRTAVIVAPSSVATVATLIIVTLLAIGGMEVRAIAWTASFVAGWTTAWSP